MSRHGTAHLWAFLAVLASSLFLAVCAGEQVASYRERARHELAVVRCIRACEASDPGDRGQGCIDLMCNPLFEGFEE